MGRDKKMKKKGRNCAQEGTEAKEDSTGEHQRADSHLSTVAVRGLPLPEASWTHQTAGMGGLRF